MNGSRRTTNYELRTTPPRALPTPSLLYPALFVLLWSTGFLGARAGSPHAEPFHFLAWRFALVVLLLAPLAWLGRAPWPNRREGAWMALAGVLTHAGYLGAVFSAVRAGMPLGLVALIGALQPVMTSVAARLLLGERLRGSQWVGIALGFAGVALVASGRFSVGRVTSFGVWACLLGTLSITAGTLLQKRFVRVGDFRSVGVVQYSAAFAVLAVAAAGWEHGPIHWTPAFLGALAWLVLVNSICAVALLYVLVARSSLAQVTSLFYLTPSVTALLAWAIFGEPVTAWMALGIGLTTVGVYLAARRG